MSSSTSTEPFADLVGRSLEILAREYPLAHRRLRERLSAMTVNLVIDDEPFGLSFTRSAVTVGAAHEGASANLRSSRRALVDLLEGREALIDAILAGRVDLIGAAEPLGRFHEGLLDYLRGAIRCPSFPRLLEDMKAQIETHAAAAERPTAGHRPERRKGSHGKAS